ncbi:carbon-nitrogen hydrolase family protein [Rhodopirellula sp. MGV]|uniref:carbon-nitrogen hydrolase family protein n=1 Tax=Rhodopirellula sp. MGV TaxID=2023130 RepID=UPI000B965106|nr:carbon-nitrogen hydrolase family protein [Rhodopirellula sp. MGV]OYP32942.1 amidohydrolase [Rhodopirellula sp. MGV]PNY35401.1 carbon-nitrogen hydrolase family protein [Rhodopirellula baltica]
MLIACVQSDVTFAKVDQNVERVCQWLEQAGQIDRGAEAESGLVVFPECMLSGYVFDNREAAFESAIEIHDLRFSAIADVCRQNQLLAVIGFVERQHDQIYNACALVGGGGVLGTYRKVHLPHLGIDRFTDRGTQPFEPIEVPGATPFQIGMAICYDGSFSEPIRCLSLSGADIVVLPTNWPVEGCQVADIVPRARSHENHIYFAAANRVGSENGTTFAGRSSICGPDGMVLAQNPGSDEGLIWADVDITQSRKKRIERVPGEHVIDRFADRQPQFYGKIGQPVE